MDRLWWARLRSTHDRHDPAAARVGDGGAVMVQRTVVDEVMMMFFEQRFGQLMDSVLTLDADTQEQQ